MRLHLLLRLLLPLLAAFALVAPAHAQVNTEKLRMTPEDEGFTGSISLSLTTKTGNVGYLDGSAGLGVANRFGKNLFFVVGSSRYAAKRKRSDRIADHTDGVERDVLSKDARYFHAHLAAARYNRFFSERVIGELYAQTEFNEFLLLDLRLLGGLGPRFVLFEEEAGAGYFGASYMAEYESLSDDDISTDEEADVLAHRLSSYLTFRVTLPGGVEVTSTTYYQPRLTDWFDFRIFNDSALTVALNDWLQWSLGFTLRHDSEPPWLAIDEGEVVPEPERRLRSTDTTVGNKISVSF